MLQKHIIFGEVQYRSYLKRLEGETEAADY